MKISIGRLRSLLRRGLDEALWRATPPARLSDVLKPMDVEADSTYQAGDEAARRWREETGAPVDPMTIDVQPAVKQREASTAWPTIFLAGDDDIDYAKDAGYDAKEHGQALLGLPWAVWHPSHWNVGRSSLHQGAVEIGSFMLIPSSSEAEEILSFAFYAPYGLHVLDLDDFKEAWDSVRLSPRHPRMFNAPRYAEVIRELIQ